MHIIPLASRVPAGRSKPAVVASSMPRGRFGEIFAHGDVSVESVLDLASAFSKIRRLHPGGVDLILIGISTVQGMKIIRDSAGFISVLIGLSRGTLDTFSVGDEVLVAFDHGALRPAGVVGFLWEGGNGPDSRPPTSNSTSTTSRLDRIRHLRHLKLA